MATANLPQLDTLTPEAKRALLGALLVDLSTHEENLQPVEADGRRFYIYSPPPDAREAAERFIAGCPPGHLDESRQRAADPPERFVGMDGVVKWCDEAEANLPPR
jgi:hypothetical protein